MLNRFMFAIVLLPLFSVVSQTCIDSNIINLDVLCPAVLQPVCGCDGVTYDNSCIALNYYGITQFSDGPCSIQQPDTCLKIPDGIDYTNYFYGSLFGYNLSSVIQTL